MLIDFEQKHQIDAEASRDYFDLLTIVHKLMKGAEAGVNGEGVAGTGQASSRLLC